MYENLVQKLREEAIQWCANCVYKSEESHICHAPEEPSCDIRDRLQAADAIEKLIEVIQNHDFLESLIKPRWIPMTERPPEKKRASYLCRTDGGYCKEVRWTNILYGLVESDNWGWCIFDIPQFSHVTHWMPLPPDPEPPKEET